MCGWGKEIKVRGGRGGWGWERMWIGECGDEKECEKTKEGKEGCGLGKWGMGRRGRIRRGVKERRSYEYGKEAVGRVG